MKIFLINSLFRNKKVRDFLHLIVGTIVFDREQDTFKQWFFLKSSKTFQN